ncbi:MAG: DUF1127 domain-containing protein [Hyphomicrobiaceae bacterium]
MPQNAIASIEPGSFFVRVLSAIRKRHAQKVATRHLSTLDDRMLKDIGIARSEIWYHVYSVR